MHKVDWINWEGMARKFGRNGVGEKNGVVAIAAKLAATQEPINRMRKYLYQV